jgi:Uma2 family endonuclease
VVVQPQFTIEDYLKIDRQSEDCYEYIDGRIYEMAGESPEHGDICTNLTVMVGGQLRNSPCRVRSKDTKVHSEPDPLQGRSRKWMFSYPDLVVICGEPQYYDERRDIVLNPAVIIEVLSEATELFDRGEKLRRYQPWNPTLTDYILVSQFAPIVEHFARQTDGSWSLHIHEGLEERLTIKSINCTLLLTEVYDRIIFRDETAETGDSEQ